jgi:hypothetical protein
MREVPTTARSIVDGSGLTFSPKADAAGKGDVIMPRTLPRDPNLQLINDQARKLCGISVNVRGYRGIRQRRAPGLRAQGARQWKNLSPS